MSVPRSILVVRARWWVVAALAVIGAGVGLGGVLLRNSRLEPSFEAVAPIAVLRLDGEADAAYNSRLNTAVAQAQAAVSGELSDGKVSVASDTDQGAIEFLATSDDPDEALNLATDLRALYLNSRPTDTAQDQLAPVLESIATEIAVVQADLADLSTIRIDEVAEVQRETLSAQLEAATRDLVSVQARLLDPSLTAAQRDNLETQESAAEATIAAIGPLLDGLPASSETVADTQARLEALVLQRRLRDLEAQYVATSLRQAQGNTEGMLGFPVLVDQTGASISPPTSVAVGLAVGVLLAVISLLAWDRYRDPIRAVDDLPGLIAIKTTRRGRKSAGLDNWYQAGGGDARRVDIQALRARIDRLVGRDKTVLICGVGTPPRDLADIAVDLAAAVAATGRTVMLVDTRVGEASFDSWNGAGPSVAEILLSQEGTVPDRSAIKRLLWDRLPLAKNLMIVPAGRIAGDAVDAVAGLNFAAIVDEARDLVDLLVLATGEVADPLSEAVAGRARLAILTAQKDYTRKQDILEGSDNLAQLGVSVGAVVLIARSSTVARSRRTSQIRRPKSSSTHEPAARHLGGH